MKIKKCLYIKQSYYFAHRQDAKKLGENTQKDCQEEGQHYGFA